MLCCASQALASALHLLEGRKKGARKAQEGQAIVLDKNTANLLLVMVKGLRDRDPCLRVALHGLIALHGHAICVWITKACKARINCLHWYAQEILVMRSKKQHQLLEGLRAQQSLCTRTKANKKCFKRFCF